MRVVVGDKQQQQPEDKEGMLVQGLHRRLSLQEELMGGCLALLWLLRRGSRNKDKDKVKDRVRLGRQDQE